MRILRVISWDKLRQEYHQERLRKTGVAPGNQGGYQVGASGDVGWSTDRGHAGSVEGIMDLMEFTDWLVQRVLFLGGLLLLVMAVSRIF